MIVYYCPACGADVAVSDRDAPAIAPSDHAWTCPSCGTRFRVEIAFHEREDEG